MLLHRGGSAADCVNLLLDEHILHLCDVRRPILSLGRTAARVPDLPGLPTVRGPGRATVVYP